MTAVMPQPPEATTTPREPRPTERKARRRGFWLLLALGAAMLCFAGLSALAFLLNEEQGPPTTKTASRTLEGDAAKIAFLAKYLDYASPVEAAEFDIDYHNNGFAPSDWNIEAAVKIAPSQAALWTQGRPSRGPADLSWAGGLLAGDPRWRTSSVPSFFGTMWCWRAVFASEGVVLVHCSTFGVSNPPN